MCITCSFRCNILSQGSESVDISEDLKVLPSLGSKLFGLVMSTGLERSKVEFDLVPSSWLVS